MRFWTHALKVARLLKNLRQLFDNRGEDKTAFNCQDKAWRERLKPGIITQENYIARLKSHYKKKM